MVMTHLLRPRGTILQGTNWPEAWTSLTICTSYHTNSRQEYIDQRATLISYYKLLLYMALNCKNKLAAQQVLASYFDITCPLDRVRASR